MLHVPGPRPGREGRLAARFDGCHAVVYGHTHIPHVDRFGDVWILNPGSPTERRSAPARSMLELVVEGRNVAPALISLGP
jgi:predicted phosphodiesterase